MRQDFSFQVVFNEASMPDPRACAVCGKEIIWYETSFGGIVAVDKEPVERGQYALVDGLACLIELLGEKASAMLEGPKYGNHVLTCKPPERKKGGLRA